ARPGGRRSLPRRRALGLGGGPPPRRDVGDPLRQPVTERGPVELYPHATAASYATSAISSTSTGESSGSTAIPTALRACLPASPSTSIRNSLAPLATCGWPVNDGALATKQVTLTIRVMASRPPAAPAAAASPFSAQIRASEAASAAVTDSPTLPVAWSLPSTMGSWPDT